MDLQPLSISSSAGNHDTGVPSSAPVISVSEKPAKKPTRQWAAWTRQEEENFFNALRQVGKNFEKITCRVQSKNKDQVRHYYYRLVRRMNKLLGPGFGLDAKNSKDTIAAMLRWWSLLEKYSCTASKLHLKPRRFKNFVEALAHQLLKDRNKSRKKRLPHGENFSSVPEATASVLHGSTNASHHGTEFIINGQITQKVGSTKNVSPKGLAANETYNRSARFTEKITKPRRKTSLVASAAYKRWEKAAMAGVAMVADAAEQLELSNNGSKNAFDQVASNRQSYKNYFAKSRENDSIAENAKESTCKNLSESCSHQTVDTQPVRKLKLQLFPVDECTRKALEKDQHNPYLELTLSSRKRIFSILEHLHRKWGNSSIASGELTLLPYTIHSDLMNSQRWTQLDKSTCAGDIYLSIGSPSIFRLRYGWLSDGDSRSEKPQEPASVLVDDCEITEVAILEKLINGRSGENASTEEDHLHEPFPLVEETGVSVPPNSHVLDLVVDIANEVESMLHDNWGHAQTEETTNMNGQEDLRIDGGTAQANEWVDSLISISVGDLLLETSKTTPSVYNGFADCPIDPSLQQVAFSCDSFDAAIAAHLSSHTEQGNTLGQSPHPSILDAEDTCDGFSSCTRTSERIGNSFREPSAVVAGDSYHGDVVGFHDLLKSKDAEPLDHLTMETETEGDPVSDQECDFESSESERTTGLADIYWPDSLGALDLDIPPTRHVSDDIFLGESISLGLSRLMASSLDAFQNCSLFSLSLDKRESSK